MKKRIRSNIHITGYQTPLPGNSLLERFPELVKEWDYVGNYPLTPKDVGYGSHKVVSWLCKKKHRNEASICSRTSGNNCPYCSGQKVCIDNCLATLNSKLASEWHPTKNGELTPYDFTLYSHKIAWWKCKYGHEWSESISNRRNLGCPYCSGQRTCRENSLAIKNPTLLKEWNFNKNPNLSPYDISPHNGKRVWWICPECGYQWRACICDRAKGTGCPKCHKIRLKDGSFFYSYPEAFYYLKYKRLGVKFKYNKKYSPDFGRHRYDFYLIKENTYIEVTSFTNKWINWQKYKEIINLKRKFVINELNAKFRFIYFRPTTEQKQYIRSHMVGKNE